MKKIIAYNKAIFGRMRGCYELKSMGLYCADCCRNRCYKLGLIGFFKFDLVSWLFGSMSLLTRIIYAIVGLGGLYLLSLYGRIRDFSQE